MRLIVLRHLLARRLCRIGLHRWRPVRNISSLDVREGGPAGVTFLATGVYFTDVCARPGCGQERSA